MKIESKHTPELLETLKYIQTYSSNLVKNATHALSIEPKLSYLRNEIMIYAHICDKATSAISQAEGNS